MEFIKELGTLALGSRLKNLSDILIRDVAKVYKEHDVDFEPRWFTFFQLLIQKGEIPVTQIARDLNQTHPAAVQVIGVLESKKLIITRKDKSDNRKRLVKLSAKGKQLANDLAPLWEIIQMATDEILNESVPDFLEKIEEVEKAIQQQSTYDRIKGKIIQNAIGKMEFKEYNDSYLMDFQKLNEDWLTSYLELTEHDIEVLSDPTGKIINKDGNIFLLISEGKVVGTYALNRINTELCELSKFTIKKEFRGWKLGERMLQHAIEKAKEIKCESVVLLTHHNLKEATNLYKKTGFEIIPHHPKLTDKTGRCSIYMQLILSNNKLKTKS